VTWPTAAQAGTTPPSRSSTKTPSPPSPRKHDHFSSRWRRIPRGCPRARVTIYPRVIDRSQLSPIISGGGHGHVTGDDQHFQLAVRGPRHFTFTVDLFTGAPVATAQLLSGNPHMRLPATARAVMGVSDSHRGHHERCLQRDLVASRVQATPVDQPLLVDYVETMDPRRGCTPSVRYRCSTPLDATRCRRSR